jgi:hypothetical protein
MRLGASVLFTDHLARQPVRYPGTQPRKTVSEKRSLSHVVCQVHQVARYKQLHGPLPHAQHHTFQSKLVLSFWMFDPDLSRRQDKKGHEQWIQ